MPKVNLYALNVHRAIPELVDELYEIVIGGNASMNSLTLTSTTASTSSSTIGAILSAGGISISNSTDASSSANGGSITTAGGVGIAKALYVGTEIVVEGTDNAVSNSDGGALTVAGGAAVAQDLYVGADLYLSGTLFGLSFVPTVSTGTYTNISSVSVVNLSSTRSGTGINFSCVCVVTPTSGTPQDTSFRLTVQSGSYPPATFTNAYDLSPAIMGWGNTPTAPIAIQNTVVNGIVGAQDFYVSFTNYDINAHYITIKIAYTHAGA